MTTLFNSNYSRFLGLEFAQDLRIESHPKSSPKHAQNVSFPTLFHHLWGGVHDSIYLRNVALRLVPRHLNKTFQPCLWCDLNATYSSSFLPLFEGRLRLGVWVKIQELNPIQNHRQNMSKTDGLRHVVVICRVGHMIGMFKPTFSHRVMACFAL